MNAVRPQALSAELKKGLALRAVEVFALDAEPRVRVLAAKHHPYSRVFHVELSGARSSKRIYVKLPLRTPRNPHILRDRLASEYHMLQELQSHQDAPRMGVVQPFGLFESGLAIATVDAEGHTLRHLIGRYARRIGTASRRRALRRIAHQCGVWLRSFQKATESGASPFDHRELIAYCHIRLKLLEQQPRTAYDKDLSEPIIRRLSAAAEHDENHTVCGRHNDFAAHNIIVGEHSLRVLDFTMVDCGSPAFDPCNFWLDLELLKVDLSYASGLIEELQSIFLSAYGLVRQDHPLFAAVRCRYTLNRLLTVLTSGTRWSYRSILDRRIAATCHRWLSEYACGA